MSPGQSNDLPHGIDEVGNAYRAADFGDEPPAHIDSLILETARREGKRRLHGYLPPLAMAATVLLAFGLVLRLSMPGHDVTEPATEPAARSAPAMRDEADVTRALLPEPSAPAADAAAPMLESTTAANEPSPAASEGVTSAGRATLLRLAPEAATEACSPPRPSEPGPWLECIRARLDADELDGARTELAELILAYPDFPIPDELAEQLRP